jgi:hypothetical protein
VAGVRWDDLFADLEAQAAAEHRRSLEAEAADLARAERATLVLTDRLRAHVGHTLGWRLRDGQTVRARLVDVGSDCVLISAVEVAGAPDVVVALSALSGLEGLSAAADADPASAVRRLGLAAVMRRLSRDRVVVRVRVLGGDVVVGTCDRVGADHVDVAVHAEDDVRSPRAVRRVCTIPFAALLTVTPLSTAWSAEAP